MSFARASRVALVLCVAVLIGLGARAAPARGVILVLGDSLSAGYGLGVNQGWVSLLQRRLAAQGRGYRVVNASISGDTTRGGLARLPQALAAHHPAVVIVELGGNDGLRGVPIEETRHNLAAIVGELKQRGIKVLLVGMRLPPNYGRAYTEQFHAIYGEIARRFDVPLVPFLLAGVAEDPKLMQRDDIHPVAAAQGRLLDNVWPYLEPLL